MCEKELSHPFGLDIEIPHVSIFLNLGIIQADSQRAKQKYQLCSDCQTLLDQMTKIVSQNANVFYFLDGEIKKVKPKDFTNKLWPKLFDVIIEDSVNEGRLFMLLMCLTRAGLIWKLNELDINHVSQLQNDLQLTLQNRLPNYDWKKFSLFLSAMKTRNRFVDHFCYIIINLANEFSKLILLK